MPSTFAILRRGSLLAAIAVFVASAPAWAEEPAVVILQPRAEQTIHDNTGRVAVTVSLGAEGLGVGRRLRLLLDGTPAGPDQGSRSATLRDVPRGEHVLQAVVVDEAGNPVASSEPVKFYMWQASKLFPSRQQKK